MNRIKKTYNELVEHSQNLVEEGYRCGHINGLHNELIIVELMFRNLKLNGYKEIGIKIDTEYKLFYFYANH